MGVVRVVRRVHETLSGLTVPITTLRPYKGNPRRGDLEAIKRSLETTGQYRPLVVNRRTGEVLAGNHTLAAAQQLGWSDVAVTYVDVDKETAARIVLVDNRAADLGTYDDEALAELLAGLPSLDGTGYDSSDLEELLASTSTQPALTDTDDAPGRPAREDVVSQEGDLWILDSDRHRVMCGSATDPVAVAALFGDDLAAAVWTDPPYGVSYVGKTSDALTIVNDNLTPEELRDDLLAPAFALMRERLRPGGAFYVCSPSGPLETQFREALEASSLRLRQQLVWVKDRFVLGHSDYHLRHESILFGWREGDAPAEPPLYDPAHETILYGWSDGAAHTYGGGVARIQFGK